MTTWYERREDIAVLQIDHPPVNGLNAATRAALSDGLRKAVSDNKVTAIIITGTGTVFSGGADIREFGTDAALAQPDLHQLLDQVEACNKPVIAAINGVCMGGGLELALACHYRIATPEATMALPEVKIGLIPGAGGTQRLPRAVGAEKALRMIVSGEAIHAEDALDHGLIERIVTRTHFGEAMDFAHEVAERRSRPKLRLKEVSLPPGLKAEQFFAAARAQVAQEARGLTAPLKCVDAVQAAVSLPFAEGMNAERAIFAERVASTESKALRHAFFAERAAARVDDVAADVSPRSIKSVAILGFGAMGAGMAMSLADAGFPVVIHDQSPAAVERALAQCREYWEAAARKGRLTLPQVEERMAHLKPTQRIEDLGLSELVIEVVHEDLPQKQDVMKRLDGLMKPGAILATSTSMLNVDSLAAVTRRAQDVIGLHFFYPAQRTRLIEVVRARKTAPDVLVTALQLAKKLKKVGVVSGVTEGFIANRMVEAYLHQAHLMIDEGASPAQVDAALERFGMSLGPLAASDQIGLDLGYAWRQRRYRDKPQLTRARVADQLVQMGRLGRKAGKGWYDYPASEGEGGGKPQTSANVQALIEANRRQLGLTARAIADEEIIGRCVLALVVEGARVLEEGVAQRASDIDIVHVLGCGFPPAQGGPMFYGAQVLGLAEVLVQIKRYAANPNAEPKFWQPPKLLIQAAQAGQWPK